MTRILYIGNALSKSGKTKTTIETLGQRLEEFCSVKITSKKSNKILRILDMMGTFFTYKSKVDYVLIDTYSTFNFYYALIMSQLCRIFKIRYIPILHGGNLEFRLKSFPRLSKLIFKNAYALVSPSNFLIDIFSNNNYKNLKFIPNTIDIEHFNFNQNRSFEQINLFWLRSFSDIYNPTMAILVLEELKNRGYVTSLVMIGPDNDGSMQRTKDLAKVKNVDVNFTGKLDKEEIITLSRSCNVFINTTNFDNTPISVMEAMALGLPIVSTNVGGIPYLIESGKEGLLVKPNDVQEMVDAILHLRENQELTNSLILDARKKVEQFDWKVVKLKWQELLS